MDKVNIATVLGFIDKLPVKVLIDTGSNVNVIRKSFFNKISNNHDISHNHKTYFKLASKIYCLINY